MCLICLTLGLGDSSFPCVWVLEDLVIRLFLSGGLSGRVEVSHCLSPYWNVLSCQHPSWRLSWKRSPELSSNIIFNESARLSEEKAFSHLPPRHPCRAGTGQDLFSGGRGADPHRDRLPDGVGSFLRRVNVCTTWAPHVWNPANTVL